MDGISTIILTLFIILLVMGLFYAIYFPPLCVAIGIATYGLKQVAQIRIEYLADAYYGYLFNIAIGGTILLAFFFAYFRRQVSFCQSGEGKALILLVYIYIGLFWFSSLWSPFVDTESNWILTVYFITYIFLLPPLMSTPERMVRAFSLLWILLLIGFAGTIFSPQFILESESGRRAGIVLYQDYGKLIGNPLSLGDNAIFLVLTSLLVFIGQDVIFRPRKGIRFVMQCFSLVGVGVGLWIAFCAGRGEFLAGTIAGSMMLVYYFFARNPRRMIFLQIIAGTIVVLILVLGYEHFYKSILELMPRYSSSVMEGDINVRLYYILESLKLAFSSAQTMLLGLGARATEEIFGAYSHSVLAQAMAETGIIGFSLLFGSYLLAFHFSLRTLIIAKHVQDRTAVLFISLILSFLIYSLIVSNKKGSLIYADSYMWLVLTAYGIDRIKTTLVPGNSVSSRLLYLPPCHSLAKAWKGIPQIRSLY